MEFDLGISANCGIFGYTELRVRKREETIRQGKKGIAARCRLRWYLEGMSVAVEWA